MKKFRAIKERKTEQATVENDLRGLHQDKLLQESLHGFLTIHGLDRESFKSIETQFDLALHDSKHHYIFHVTTRNLLEGEHKKQSIALFIAAIKTHMLHPNTSMHLSTCNMFRHNLEESIKEHKHKALEKSDLYDHLVHDWVNHKSALTLTSDIQHYLAQAGFNIKKTDKDLNLSHDEVQNLHDQFKHELENQHSQASRKVVGG